AATHRGGAEHVGDELERRTAARLQHRWRTITRQLRVARWASAVPRSRRNAPRQRSACRKGEVARDALVLSSRTSVSECRDLLCVTCTQRWESRSRQALRACGMTQRALPPDPLQFLFRPRLVAPDRRAANFL